MGLEDMNVLNFELFIFGRLPFLKKKNVFLFRPLFVLGKLNRAQTEIQTQDEYTCFNKFRFRRASFYSKLNSWAKVSNILTKTTALWINLNMDVAPKLHAHTHPSHSQTSRLLFTSLSLGTPVPRYT